MTGVAVSLGRASGGRLRELPLSARISLGVIVLWLAIATLVPLWTDPLARGGPILQAPSVEYPFGTDELGRDVLVRVLWGARLSLPYAVLLVVLSTAVGVVLGGLAGYVGGAVDGLVMRSTDLVFAFPRLLIAMALTAALGPGLINAVIAGTIVSWPYFARVARGLVIGAIGSDYVATSRLVGSSSLRALVVDVAPNVAGPLVVIAMLEISGAALFLAGLSFLGLGAQPPYPEWGAMMLVAYEHIDRWWLGLFPGLAMCSVVLAFNLLGDAARDAFDVRVPDRARQSGGRW